MATFKKGGTSRGAGAAKKGFDYAIYKKGGSIKKYQEGGALRDPATGDYLRDPSTGTRQYASFGDWMKDLKREFGGKSEKAEAPKSRAAADDITPLTTEERVEAQRPYQQVTRASTMEGGAGDRIRQEAIDREAARARARSARRAPMPPPPAPRVGGGMPSEARDEMMRSVSRIDPMSFGQRFRRTMRGEPEPSIPAPGSTGPRRVAGEAYAKGGKVKMAGGGSCRGMGAAQRGGKYTIK